MPAQCARHHPQPRTQIYTQVSECVTLVSGQQASHTCHKSGDASVSQSVLSILSTPIYVWLSTSRSSGLLVMYVPHGEVFGTSSSTSSRTLDTHPWQNNDKYMAHSTKKNPYKTGPSNHGAQCRMDIRIVPTFETTMLQIPLMRPTYPYIPDTLNLHMTHTIYVLSTLLHTNHTHSTVTTQCDTARYYAQDP